MRSKFGEGKSSHTRKSLLTSASVLAAAATAIAATPALAQDEEAIVVTGSRIPQPNLVTTSPVTQVTSEDITTQGVTRVEDMTNQLPQVFAAQGANVSNAATGTAQVNLRGLGPSRTLVLIDGRRMGYGSPGQGGAPADLNQIPGPLVERVEVLTGGASAVYGSDAVAGVVNFIMRDDFEGFRVDAQYGFFQHNNNSDDGYIREEIAYRSSLNPAEFQLPPDDVVDGYGKEITFIFGASTPDGRGNITGYIGYRNNDAVLQRDRDYSACALGNSDATARPYTFSGQHWTCGGSGTSFPGLFTTDFSAANSFTIDQATGNFILYNANLNAYNFGPLNYYQRPDERYTGGFFARYEINEHAEAYGNFMFSDYRSVAQIAPSGNFFSTGTINCGNPLLTPANAATIGCTAAEIAADSPTTLYIGRRNIEGGGRQDDLNFESYRAVFGVRGPLSDTWRYDVFGQYYRVNLNRSYLNDFSITRLTNALDVITGDGSGNLGVGVVGCRSFDDGTDPNCVPYDIFTPGGVTQAALDYLQIPLLQRGEAILQNVVATIGGDLGITSPAAETPVQVSLGLEYRSDGIDQTVDQNFLTGNASGQGGPTTPLTGDTDVFELFGEMRIPLIEGAAFADLVSLELAYRYSEYDSGINTDTYKVGMDWAPTEDIRFRGSFQHAVRAPNVIELFTAQGFNLFDNTDDPCGQDDGGDGIAPMAACVGVNPWQVTAGQYGSAGLTSPAGQYNFLQGGNADLQPEEADTYTIGFVATPRFVPGLTFSIDYFNIEVENLISTVGPTNSLNACYFNGDPASCARIIRNPGTGQLWVGAGNVVNLNTNIGGLTTSGYDINANYSMDIGNLGGLSFQLIGTLLEELVTDPGSGFAPYDCVGGFSNICSTPGINAAPNPEWRHRFRVSWETPWDLQFSGTWRYYGEVERRNAANAPVPGLLDTAFDAEQYLDLAGNWNIYDNTNIRFGVNNVLDNDPPLSANVGTTGNGNTYPQTYDALGRWIFVGATVDF